MKSLVLAPFSDAGLARLRALGGAIYEPWTATQTLWDPEELGLRLGAEGCGALVVEADFVFEELFAAAPQLEVVAVCRGALNHVDLDAADAAGVVVVHTPGRNAQAVAELVIGHLFALARRAPEAERYVREGKWTDLTEPYTRFQGRELAGAALGVIGFGAVGRAVARLGAGIGMRTLACDPYVTEAEGVELVTLDELLRTADCVTLQTPDTASTAGMMNAERIASMKPGALLVNAGSPYTIDHRALAEAVSEGRLGGAALDVHETQPLAPDSPLLGLPNVLFTPHIGGATRETIERHSAMAAEDIERFAQGLRPLRLANPDAWERRR